MTKNNHHASPIETLGANKLILIQAFSLLILSLGFYAYLGFEIPNTQKANSLIAAYISYFAGVYSLYKLNRYPGSKTLLNLPSIMITIAGLVALIFTSFRIEYSRGIFTAGSILTPLAILIQHKLSQAKKGGLYLVIPYGCYEKLISDHSNIYELLPTPGFANRDITAINGIIFDQHSALPDHWQQFLAQAANKDIPLYDINHVYESVFGKSPLEHLPETTTSSLKPHWLYRSLKRTLESLAIAITAIAWIPLILVFAIAIKLESKGPAFFIQRRVGRSGKEFNMIKLRSMRTDSEVNGAQFAGEDDPRITRIGRIIRKIRIDEIPQFINVLKGDMALIGPRPEQKAFVQEFEEKIPLYTLRHIVKPGITGWAQVTHGYADNEESTREKLAYDFYYVKNLSLWLDATVVVKTVKTMLSGFGAR